MGSKIKLYHALCAVCVWVRGCTTVRTPIRIVPSDNLLWLWSLIPDISPWVPLRRFDHAGKNIPWGSCILRISFQNPMTSWWNSFDSINFYLIQHTPCTQCCEMRPWLCLISKRRSQRNSVYLNQYLVRFRANFTYKIFFYFFRFSACDGVVDLNKQNSFDFFSY